MPAYILAIDQGTHASRALGPALSWQDRRAHAELYPFAESEKLVRHITGLPLSPHYGAGKIGWLLAHDRAVWAAAEDNRLCVGPLTSFLLWHLLETHDYCVDASNAHRMLLLDVRRASWSETFLELFQIGKSLLPKVLPVRHGNFLEATAKGAAWLAAGRPSGWFSPTGAAGGSVLADAHTFPQQPRFIPQTDPGLRARFDAFTSVVSGICD